MRRLTLLLHSRLRFFDNILGSVRCVFFSLERVERATAELLFQSIDKFFQASDTSLTYDHLIGLGNVMLGARNSVMSRLRSKQPALVAMHCHCHIAALVAHSACKVLPNDLEDLTTDVWYYFLSGCMSLNSFNVLLEPNHTSF